MVAVRRYREEQRDSRAAKVISLSLCISLSVSLSPSLSLCVSLSRHNATPRRDSGFERVVFASCHNDIVGDLQPDWVFDTHSDRLFARKGGGDSIALSMTNVAPFQEQTVFAGTAILLRW